MPTTIRNSVTSTLVMIKVVGKVTGHGEGRVQCCPVGKLTYFPHSHHLLPVCLPSLINTKLIGRHSWKVTPYVGVGGGISFNTVLSTTPFMLYDYTCLKVMKVKLKTENISMETARNMINFRLHEP